MIGNLQAPLHPSWMEYIGQEFEKPYFKELENFLKEEANTTVFPPSSKIFAALQATPFSEIKVVILGQDPYHGPGQANGLSFSVNDGMPLPPSLKNIFKELVSDIGIPYPTSGNLEPWARQGVLLLNATLTVRANQPGSHQKRGWETFTNEIIHQLSLHKQGVVFLLWGKFAQEKQGLIHAQNHRILMAAHPSPLSAYNGFFGCKHFSKTNDFLRSIGKSEIDWKLGMDLFS
ncbi:MAG: uracil-DNA glycosylase [Bacteroidia bacterium]|nr:uracil-DNA glycosylase [Bacteroidia bacterium]